MTVPAPRAPRFGRTTKKDDDGPALPRVSSAGPAYANPANRPAIRASMLALALAEGFAVGALAWACLRLVTLAAEVTWAPLATLASGGAWWAPMLACALAGALVAAWGRRFPGSAPRPLPKVVAQVRETGAYDTPNLPAALVAMLLPLAFGASVGPEAGVAGLTASLCTRVSRSLRRAGVALMQLPEVSLAAALTCVFGAPFAGVALPLGLGGGRRGGKGGGRAQASGTRADVPYAFRRPVRLVLYATCALGAWAAMAALGSALGRPEGLPRFPALSYDASQIAWFVPLAACGVALAALMRGAGRLLGAGARAASRLPGAWLALPVLCGALLGSLWLRMPLALFSGETQAADLMARAPEMGWATLVATALVKAVLTPLCLAMGWRGGQFFPMVFVGTCMGWGLALATGQEPAFCAAVTCASLLGAATGRALVTLGILLLCYPAFGLAWMCAATAVGVGASRLARLAAKRRRRGTAGHAGGAPAER